jgi:hypothetical protein
MNIRKLQQKFLEHQKSALPPSTEDINNNQLEVANVQDEMDLQLSVYSVDGNNPDCSSNMMPLNLSMKANKLVSTSEVGVQTETLSTSSAANCTIMEVYGTKNKVSEPEPSQPSQQQCLDSSSGLSPYNGRPKLE